ncbi:MAG: TetR/AcrR family transcriptional regulator [Bacillota bacterium]|nr:TetR/AcrR family transcriptional regulator [Bacillota bacterium]
MKEKILIATLELAEEKGLGKISMSQIAQKVGLKKSSLYSHYASKEEIIENMYSYFRAKAKMKQGSEIVDYGKMVEGHSFSQVLWMAVQSYKKINSDKHMEMFYKVIESQRAMDPMASQILVKETETMIQATKSLFYACEVKKIAHFENPDAAALVFAMGVHALIEYEQDANHCQKEIENSLLETFIKEFSSKYEKG